jgi:hypothetical protein
MSPKSDEDSAAETGLAKMVLKAMATARQDAPEPSTAEPSLAQRSPDPEAKETATNQPGGAPTSLQAPVVKSRVPISPEVSAGATDECRLEAGITETRLPSDHHRRAPPVDVSLAPKEEEISTSPIKVDAPTGSRTPKNMFEILVAAAVVAAVAILWPEVTDIAAWQFGRREQEANELVQTRDALAEAEATKQRLQDAVEALQREVGTLREGMTPERWYANPMVLNYRIPLPPRSPRRPISWPKTR